MSSPGAGWRVVMAMFNAWHTSEDCMCGAQAQPMTLREYSVVVISLVALATSPSPYLSVRNY
jgi:hypothetical protein